MPLDISDHFFIKSSNDINDLIEPLVKYFGISYFVYKRNYGNGRVIRLSNHSDFTEQYYYNDLHHISQFECDPHNYQPGFVTWSQVRTHGEIHKISDQFQINDGIVLCVQSEKYAEHFAFGGSTTDPYLVSRLLNNMDLIERFILYFKERGSQLIDEATRNVLTLPNHNRFIAAEEDGVIFRHDVVDRNGFLSEIPFKNFPLKNGCFLTKKEFECAQLLIQGKTQSEVAETMFLSPRTIESHTNSMKSKLMVGSRSELIAKLIENGFQVDGRVSLY